MASATARISGVRTHLPMWFVILVVFIVVIILWALLPFFYVHLLGKGV